MGMYKGMCRLDQQKEASRLKSIENKKERFSFYKTAGWPLANIKVTSL